MIRRALTLILLATVFAVAGAAAQTAPVPLRPGPSLLWERPPSAAAQRAREPLGGLLGPDDEDYRYPGFFVGAGLGLVLTTVGFMICNEADNGCDGSQALGLGVLVTGVLGLSGAVIGGFMPKS